MAFFVRKITRAKWPESEVSVEEIPADVISIDLRTQQNRLSFWRIETLDDLEKAALALAVSSNTKSIEKIDVVYISEEEIRAAGIVIDNNSPGDTVVGDLMKLHCDFCELNYGSLGRISILINNNMQGNHYKRYSRKELRGMVGKAFRDQRICQDKCKEELFSEILSIA